MWNCPSSHADRDLAGACLSRRILDQRLSVAGLHRWALISAPAGRDGGRTAGGNGPSCPRPWGALAAMPFERVAVSRHRAIAARGRGIRRPSATCPRHHPRHGDADRLGLHDPVAEFHHPSIEGDHDAATGAKSTINRSFRPASSGEPLLDGFRAIYGADIAQDPGGHAVIGLIASFHPIIFAQGRQIYSLSRARTSRVGCRHARHLQYAACGMSPACRGPAIMRRSGSMSALRPAPGIIGGTLINMAVFGAMCPMSRKGCRSF